MKQARVNRLPMRQVALVALVIVPTILALVVYVTVRAERLAKTSATDQLEKSSASLARSISGWMDNNVTALQLMVALPGITGNDPAEQKPVLEAMANSYRNMRLVSTTDMRGANVARSDDGNLEDFSDHAWFQEVAGGSSLTFETSIGPTAGEPVLVASMPIRDQSGSPVGVGMFVTDLSSIAEQIQVAHWGETGFAYVVNDSGQVVAHPDPVVSSGLTDLSSYAPVTKVLDGYSGSLEFTDENHGHWLAFVESLEHGWGLIVQQKSSEVFHSLRLFRPIAWIGLVLATGLVLSLTWFITNRMLRPVAQLTTAASALAHGDFDQTVPVESGDELGTLAVAFNTMTVQLRELVTDLRSRVAERTDELTRRANETEEYNRQQQRRVAQLEASASVAHSVASVLDADQLLEQVVRLISDTFGHYHTGVFLLDETGHWAVLRAANSTGGKRMLARGHRLEVGAQGIVGNVAKTAHPHVAQNVNADAIYFDNPELGDTQTEIALPLLARGQIIGVLDIQSMEPNAFDEIDVSVLSALADQIAVALDNARLYEASRTALAQVQAAQQHYTKEVWGNYNAQMTRDFFEYRQSVSALTKNEPRPIVNEVLSQGITTTVQENGKAAAVFAPIKLRGTVIGALGLEASNAASGEMWSEEEIALIETVADQVAQAVEAARLFDETERRARREQLVSEISDRIRSAPDMESILRTAVQEIRRTLGVSHGAIRLGTEAHLRPPESPTAKTNKIMQTGKAQGNVGKEGEEEPNDE